MPIDELSKARRIPRLGKFHLGVKVQKKNEKGEITSEYPKAVDYFVIPADRPDLVKLLGEKPKTLEIMFPTENIEDFAPQWYRRYSITRGLVCKGDGITCARMVDTERDGVIADRDSKKVEWREGLPCHPKDCPEVARKFCKPVMNLMFLLPGVPDLGVYQVDTGSINSIININSSVDFIRKICKRISFVPLTLSLDPQQVNNPDDGKKKTVHVLQLHIKETLPQLMTASNQAARLYLAMPAPDTNEAPDPDEADEDGTFSGDTPLKPLSKEPVKEVIVEKAPAPAVKPPAAPTTTEKPIDPNAATQAQIGKIMASACGKGISLPDVGLYASNQWQVAHMNKLTKKQASDLIELIESGKFKEGLDKLVPQSEKDIDFDEKPPEAPVKAELTEEDRKRMQKTVDAADKVLATPITPPAVEPVKAPPAPAAPKRDPDTIKTSAQMANAACGDFHKTMKEVYKELGISGIADLTISPANAYRTLEKIWSEKHP